MKQFLAILSFELKSYFKNKIFLGVTAFLLLATTCFMFFPSLHKAFGNVETDEKPVMLVADEMDADQSALQQVFAGAFPDYQVEVTSDDANALRSSVESGDAECAFFLRSLTDYTYFVRSLTMYDTNTQTADELLKNTYYLTALTKSGMTPEQAQNILTTPVIHDIQSLEKEQQSTFLRHQCRHRKRVQNDGAFDNQREAHADDVRKGDRGGSCGSVPDRRRLRLSHCLLPDQSGGMVGQLYV